MRQRERERETVGTEETIVEKKITATTVCLCKCANACKSVFVCVLAKQLILNGEVNSEGILKGRDERKQ